jgi:hypothetical protein
MARLRSVDVFSGANGLDPSLTTCQLSPAPLSDLSISLGHPFVGVQVVTQIERTNTHTIAGLMPRHAPFQIFE